MTYGELNDSTVLELRKIAKNNGVKLSAGISKADIITRIWEKIKDEPQPDVLPSTAPKPYAEQPSAPAAPAEAQPAQSAPQPAARPPIRHAAILIDDEPDIDDIPVLTPNPGIRPAAVEPVRVPAPRASSQPAPAPVPPAAHAPMSTRPAFTLEGVRAWHNPRAYPGAGAPAVPPARTPAPPAASPWQRQMRAPLPRDTVRAPGTPARPPYGAPSRFGPEDAARPEQEAPVRAETRDYSVPYQPRSYQPAETPRAYSPVEAPRRAPDAPYLEKELSTANPAVPEMLATGECGDGAGVLEVHPDGYGFLRADNFLPGKNDVYVSNAQIRRFSLRSGDYIEGKTRPRRETDRYAALLYITAINGAHPDDVGKREAFDELAAVYPDRRIDLSQSADRTLRQIDLLSPIGFGQRAGIIAPRGTQRAALINSLASGIAAAAPDAELMLLLVDQRPEDVTDIREQTGRDVKYATFDDTPENQIRVSELTLERAVRQAEQGKDVVLLLDSLTGLARAYNALAPQTARALQSGLVPQVLYKVKHFVGVAKNVRQGGSVTIIAVLNTGAPLDNDVRAELTDTWNMTLTLASDAGIRRAVIDPQNSCTLRSELLQSKDELKAAQQAHKALAGLDAADALTQADTWFEQTQTNAELVEHLLS